CYHDVRPGHQRRRSPAAAGPGDPGSQRAGGAAFASLGQAEECCLVLQSRNIPTLAAGLIMLAVFAGGVVRYDHFGTLSDVASLLNDYAYVLIAAAGATVVILLGGIDLSVGSVVAFSGVLLAVLVGRGWHPLAASLACIAAGAGMGAIM